MYRISNYLSIRTVLVALLLICSFASLYAEPETPELPEAPQSNATNRFTGVVIDAETGDSICYAKLQYKGDNKAYTASFMGEFDIPRNTKLTLEITAFGYKTVRMNVGTKAGSRVIRMKPDLTTLKGVEVVAKKTKYVRKGNPAVELMERVIAANKENDLRKVHEFYQYRNYQKLTLAMNDVDPDSLKADGEKRKKQWYIDQIAFCPHNGKYILPINYEETVSQRSYRRRDGAERTTVTGKRTEGINQVLDMGENLNVILDDVFKDVDVYKSRIDLLQYKFISPIATGATSFYRYFITDTLKVDSDRCIKLAFSPNNPQDIGFSGNIYVLADSTYHLRRCELTLPKQSEVNWVSDMKINVEYEQLENGEWVQTKDDMFCELTALTFLPKAAVLRTTRRSDYSFEAVPDAVFSGMGDLRVEEGSDKRDSLFWAEHRPELLSLQEQNMQTFVKGMKKSSWYTPLIVAAKVFVENYIGLGTEKHPAYVDFGPLNSLVSYNSMDGVRTRFSFASTSQLSKHWFAEGYITKGWGGWGDGLKLYGGGKVTYSFNRKNKTPGEYPKRNIFVKGGYDNMAPSDQFSVHDKDNIFTMFKWKKDEKRIMYDKVEIGFDWEQHGGLEYKAGYNWVKQRGMGELDGQNMTLSEVNVGLRYAPGEKVITTKERRIRVNRNTPVFELKHTMGIKGFLGGSHNYNSTELSAYYRLWLNDWGRLTSYARGNVQWNKVPYLQLVQPPANMSLVSQHHNLNLMSDMEFLNDRQVFFEFVWEPNGRFFNRIPFIKKLKWREFLCFKGAWGALSAKNRPFDGVDSDGNNRLVNQFDGTFWPLGSDVMNGKKPYLEAVVGIHNIFSVFSVEYVRRLTYTDHGSCNGVRVNFEASF